MDVHPAAELFPMMGEKEYQGLLADIKENGLRESIVLYRERLLDGRSRLRACQEGGVEPRFRDHTGDDPYAYSVSANLHRRNLTSLELVIIATEAYEPLMIEARRRQLAVLRTGSESPSVSIDTDGDFQGKGRSREIVGRLFGVPHAQIGRAWAVKSRDPELFEKVKRKEMTLWAAHQEVIEPKPKAEPNGRGRGMRKDPTQSYVVGSKRSEELAGGQRARLVDGLSQIKGICRGLEDVDLGMAAAVCEPEEIESWAAMAGKLAAALRQVQRRLLEVA